jgi:glycosyltransferase involved in cell wall biosynthesis
VSELKEPLFSVIIPAYNAQDFICDALDSVASQSYTDYEIMVVDDGSLDKTYDKALEWSRHHPLVNIKIIQQTNKGIGGARNTALNNAHGAFAAFLDADDLWLENKLTVLARYLKANPSVDLVCHDIWFQSQKAAKKRLGFGPYTTYRDLLFKGNSISTSATIVRRQQIVTIGGFSEDLSFNSAEDYNLWLHLARRQCRIKYLHEVLSTYRDWGQGVSNNIPVHNTKIMNVFDAHFQEWQPQNIYYRYLARRYRGALIRSASYALYKQGDYLQARKYVYSALKQDLFNLKTWAVVLLNVFQMIKANLKPGQSLAY